MEEPLAHQNQVNIGPSVSLLSHSLVVVNRVATSGNQEWRITSTRQTYTALRRRFDVRGALTSHPVISHIHIPITIAAARSVSTLVGGRPRITHASLSLLPEGWPRPLARATLDRPLGHLPLRMELLGVVMPCLYLSLSLCLSVPLLPKP